MAIWRRLLARPSSEDARLLEAVFAGLGILIGVIGIATSQDPGNRRGFRVSILRNGPRESR
jgi:hypothetical protein